MNTAAASRANLVMTNARMKNLAANLRNVVYIQYTRDFAAPIEAGEVMGTMTYFLDSGEAVEYNLVASRKIAERENKPKTLQTLIDEANSDTSPFPKLSL